MSQMKRCALCLSETDILPLIISIEDKYYELCNGCAGRLNTCLFCKTRDVCEFETNEDPTPKFVRKEVVVPSANGMVKMVQEVRNEERTAKFCQYNECHCYYELEGKPMCHREDGGRNCDRRIEHIYGNFYS